MTRILIADDSPPVRKALSRLLSATQCSEVIEVEDGQAAFLRTLELKPDLVIVDLAMPVMDGLTAAREISKALPKLPIVMYTMHWTPWLELAAQKSGVSKVVQKGNSQGLLSVIEELLGEDAQALPDAPQAALPPLDLPTTPPAAVPDPGVIAATENGTAMPPIDPKKKPPEN